MTNGEICMMYDVRCMISSGWNAGQYLYKIQIERHHTSHIIRFNECSLFTEITLIDQD
jgi:hypothetical protein